MNNIFVVSGHVCSLACSLKENKFKKKSLRSLRLWDEGYCCPEQCNSQSSQVNISGSTERIIQRTKPLLVFSLPFVLILTGSFFATP